MLTKENLNEALADAVMGRPREFFIDDRRFSLWSPSLGMTLMTERHISLLGIDSLMMTRNPSLEALRLSEKNRTEVCNILAIHSYRRYKDLSDSEKLRARADYFSSHLSTDEIAQLFLIILSEPRIETFLQLSGISEDQKEQSRIAQFKNKDGHNRTFGGKTIYGMIIDAACRAYGWTKEYTVWGIDLLSLRLMLADTISSVYLSDDDIKQMGIIVSSKDCIGMTAEDFEQLKKEFND